MQCLNFALYFYLAVSNSIKTMEYKLYLQSKSTIPSSTKRRWSDCHKGFRKKQYKAWLQDPVRQDDTSNSEDENSSSCYKTETAPHHTSDDTSNSEDENSSPCYETDTESYHTTMDAEAYDNTQNYDGENPKTTQDKIYPTAKISNEESQLAILCYALRHTTTKSALGDLLDLINLHCPEGTNGAPNSLYTFLKEFDYNSFEIVYICPTCHQYFGNEIPANCDSCGFEPGDKNSLIKSGDVFMKLSIRKQLEDKMSDSTFTAALNYKWTRVKSSPDSVQDIFDGEMYKSVGP
ncbi:uncharacterized protein LOC131534721 [Onychostoma macrolepis]|nr:uncharacterized protein LOC131534721 [Onychostoma macrolepis]